MLLISCSCKILPSSFKTSPSKYRPLLNQSGQNIFLCQFYYCTKCTNLQYPDFFSIFSISFSSSEYLKTVFQKGLSLEATVFGHFVPNAYNLFTSLTVVSITLFQAFKESVPRCFSQLSSKHFSKLHTFIIFRPPFKFVLHKIPYRVCLPIKMYTTLFLYHV